MLFTIFFVCSDYYVSEFDMAEIDSIPHNPNIGTDDEMDPDDSGSDGSDNNDDG